MPKIKVLPRDIHPGDKVERLTPDLATAWVEVQKVEPRKYQGRTNRYEIYLVPPADVSPDLVGNRIASWPEYAIYRRFTVANTQRVTVEREEA